MKYFNSTFISEAAGGSVIKINYRPCVRNISIVTSTNRLIGNILTYNNAGMNLDWKWPEGFTPLTGLRSMVNLDEHSSHNIARWQSEDLVTDTIPIQQQQQQPTSLVEFSEPASSLPMENQVKLGNKLTNTYYQCRAGRDATFKDRSIETATGATLGCVVGGGVGKGRRVQ